MIIFGTAGLSGEAGGYGFGKIDETAALALLNEAYRKGIYTFDTAPIYGFGQAEKYLGMAFSHHTLREKVKIISKCGVTWGDNKRVDMTNDPKVCVKMLEQTLRDLNSEYVDYYLVHWPDPKIDIRSTLEVLLKEQNKGKILKIGLSNTTLNELKLAQELGEISLLQGQYNFFSRENSVLFNQGIPFQSWGTLDKGILTGRVNANRKFDEWDCRSWAPWWKKDGKIREKKFLQVSQLEIKLKALNFTLLDFAISFNYYSMPENSTMIMGMKNSWDLDAILGHQRIPFEVMKNDFHCL